jgi:plastocyanin
MRRTGTVLTVMAMGVVVVGAAWQGARPGERGGAAVASTVTVNMIGTSAGYKFDPASITIKAGDAVKWVVVSGAPHNVSFDENGVPAGAVAVLAKAMPNQQAKLVGPLMASVGDTYTVSFAGAPAGTYQYYCLPHQSVNMTGTITVE